jgi:hypothetical protein
MLSREVVKARILDSSSLPSSESPMLVYTSTTKYENVLAPVGDMSSAVIGAMSPAQALIPATFRHHELSPHLDGSTYRKVSTTRVAR